MSDTAIDALSEQEGRPQFLTVICILSFIGGGWAFLQSLYSLFSNSSEDALADLEEAQEQLGELGNDVAAGFMDTTMEMTAKAVEYNVELSSSGAILSLISLLGVFMMFKLKKTGFFIYIIANILALLPSLIYLGTSWIVIASIGTGALVTLVFIILYGINLKHMK